MSGVSVSSHRMVLRFSPVGQVFTRSIFVNFTQFSLSLAVRFVLSFDTFLQVKCGVSVVNAGTVSLVLAAILAAVFFFGPNFNATLTAKCSYQFSPWIVFIIFFWGVVENNWIPRDPTRNNIIAAIELVVTLVSAVGALALFAIRYRSAKIDTIA